MEEHRLLKMLENTEIIHLGPQMPHKAGACGSNYENKISLSVMWAFLLLYWIFLFVLTYVKVAFQASVGMHRLYILLNFISLFVKKCWEKSNVSSFLQALVYFFPFPSTLFLCFLFPVGVSWYSTMLKTYWIFQKCNLDHFFKDSYLHALWDTQENFLWRWLLA